MEPKINIEKIALEILRAKAVEIRDVDGGEKPFLYTSSGNWGPGYVSIKNLVGRKKIIKFLVRILALKIAEEISSIDFVAGNVTGGVIPGWLISEELEKFLGRVVPCVYIREAKKKGGQQELITGITNNPEISLGANGLIVDETVNFAQATCNAAQVLREAGYSVTHAACILFYNNPEAIKALERAEIEMIFLLTLPQLLEVAEKHHTHSQTAIEGYREFLRDPLGWQAKRGLKPLKED